MKIFIWEKKGRKKCREGGGGEHQVKCEKYQPGSKGCRDGRHMTPETAYKVLTLWWMWDR